MSLRVWLPLTKDLRQQGISSVIATNSGATYSSTEGKLGGCYNFTTSSYQKIGFPYSLANYTEFTVCVWVKPISTTITGCLFTFVNPNDYWQFVITNGNNVGIRDNSTGETGSRKEYTLGSFVANTWTHLAISYDKGVVKIYKDGVLFSTNNTGGSAMNNYSGTNAAIGESMVSSSSYYFAGSVNDFRLYDHCISPMEVKELAKGLVLHYPLNRNGWGQENLLTSSYRDITTWDRTAQGVWSITHNNESNTAILVSTASWEHLYKLLPITFETGMQYTLSCRYKALQNYNRWSSPYSVGLSLNANNPGSGNAQYPTDIIIPFGSVATEYIEDKITFTAATTTYYLDINGGYIADGSQNVGFEIANIKLEKGAKMTSWCPNSSDALATTMGLNGTTEYDCSGFCNNGEKIGALTYTSDTPKYQVSTHIGATSQKIHISGLTTSGFGNSYSFAWWGKRTSNNPMFWGFSDGIRLNGMYIGTLWNTGDGSNNPLYKIGTTTQVTAPSVNVWHHYVMTGNGTKCYVYLDGELWAEAKTYKAISGTSIYINGWNSATDYCSDNTDISDFRIYATALSASEVKSLYQNSAYIDSSGNIYGAVHSEV